MKIKRFNLEMSEEAFIEENLDTKRLMNERVVFQNRATEPFHVEYEGEGSCEIGAFIQSLYGRVPGQYLNKGTHIRFPRNGGFELFLREEENDTSYNRRMEYNTEDLKRRYRIMMEQARFKLNKDYEKLQRFNQFQKLKKEFEPEAEK